MCRKYILLTILTYPKWFPYFTYATNPLNLSGSVFVSICFNSYRNHLTSIVKILARIMSPNVITMSRMYPSSSLDNYGIRKTPLRSECFVGREGVEPSRCHHRRICPVI